jgi:hypothetical protein
MRKAFKIFAVACSYAFNALAVLGLMLAICWNPPL